MDVLQHNLVFMVETFSISFLIISVRKHLSHYPLFLSSRVSVGQFCRRTEQLSVPNETDTLLRILYSPAAAHAVCVRGHRAPQPAPCGAGAAWAAAAAGELGRSEHVAAPLWSGLT